MNWKDEGFLLSKNKYGENSIIIEVFTLNHGKCSGIVYGGTSRKLKNYLQLGNKIHIEFKSKSENKLGYFKVEIINAISPFFFDDKKKIHCLLSSLNLIKVLLPELQNYNKIYDLYSNFLVKLKSSDDWIVYYIFWEIELLKEIGFDMNLSFNAIISENSNNNMFLVNIDNEKLKVPGFLIKRNFNKVDHKDLYFALKFIGKYLEKNILTPNNLIYPFSRKKLEENFV